MGLGGTRYVAEDGTTVLVQPGETLTVTKIADDTYKFEGSTDYSFVGKLVADTPKYAMAIQCGGCMSTRKQLLNRTNLFVNQGIPISNYGMALAYMNGIFERVMTPFR